MEWISVLLLGFFLGMKHSTDADHVVAVTTIVSQQRKLSAASLIGAVWGVGHTFTVLIIGSAIIYLKLSISPHVGLSLEFSVGVMIVILGLLSLKNFIPYTNAASHSTASFQKKYIRSLIVGLVHGMAGSAAVALLVLQSISNQKLALIYLLIFALGTMLGMMLVTIIIGLPYIYANKLQRFNRILGISTALFSIGFGLMLMYELGLEKGLFTDHPIWSPK